MTVIEGPWVDELVAQIVTTMQVHDEPMPGAWACGRCPYFNVGAICTKCGAHRWESNPASALPPKGGAAWRMISAA